MASRRDYLLKKGLQVKQLNEDAARSAASPKSAARPSSKEVAAILELCPPGTPDTRIVQIIKQNNGDADKISLAVSDLWEENSTQDDWATVSKKQPKKKHDEPKPKYNHSPPTTYGDSNGGRGRGGTRGRGAPARGAWAQKPSFVAKKQAPPKPQPQVQQQQQHHQQQQHQHIASPVVHAGPKPVSPKTLAKNQTWGVVTDEPKVVVAEPEPVWPSRSPKKAEKKMEPEATIASWGASLQEAKAHAEWEQQQQVQQQQAPTTTTNAWARPAPIETPKSPLPSPKKEKVATPKAMTPVRQSSPTHSLTFGSPSPKSSPIRNKFSMGRWETVAETELSLQFGSFSLEAIDTTPAATSVASATWGTPSNKTTANAWSPKKHESPKTKASVPPPGMDAQVSPRKAASPRKQYTPAAPSPASLPKPDDVKRQVPKYTGANTQAAPASPNMASPSFDLKGSNLYPANPSAYNQYSVGIAGRNQGAIGGNSTPISKMQPQLNARSATTPNTTGTATGPVAAAPAAAAPATTNPAPTANPAAQQQHQQQPQHMQHQQPPYQQPPMLPGQSYHPHFAPPPPPGMAMPYNPYNYGNYYPQQGYGYYQSPQYPQYSPRQQYPPRGSMPYGMEGLQGFSNPQTMPLGYQDPHQVPQEYVPQGFGELGYLPPPHAQPTPVQQGGVPQRHSLQQPQVAQQGKQHQQQQQQQQQQQGGAPQSQGRPEYAPRDHTQSPPVPNVGGYPHYGGWSGYGHQGLNPQAGWNGGYPQQPQGYRPYTGNAGNDGQNAWSS
ncbi:hypothetical protein SPRG_19144 [Saprolegnia parasitica CBS 223.65]|uniref:Uncharacterized protein n=1 Tax=Saprolegnia parasitica (strain CBS 223.65) TaxID=695850 RepID=A0A067CV74_SAPPC|nr:hypothetical protein SPRG_19144 [Saprolegnia parasitica CBS 223.65]KDO34418.1 hypothetical protein SPRG_19144 [Saprolegnia parasitica CBS 223.65]|eukprot:XP_012195328.1 hypothetical protein SPRG_19144 [Saprolegnia parasitica CBS 223.65]